MKIFLIMLLLCSQILTAAAANIPLMPVRDLKPGMQGIGKTVISGEKIEEFNVEILGVSGSEPSRYSIFVRLYGDLIDKTGGVAQGMSGSPVYVDGRLVGAVAFGKVFNDSRYCFLTPISQMLPLLDTPRSLPQDWIPKGTSLMASGFTDYGLEYLQGKLEKFGLSAVNSGASGNVSSKNLEPGSAVGVSIMQGDLSLGALGTVTWTDDVGNVLAFGHSFMQRGASNFFMNKVWVLGVVPNLQSGYKVGNIGSAIGSFTQDRSSGIGGRENTFPAAIPVFVTANDSSRGKSTSMRVQIAEDEQLLPTVVDAAVVNTISKTIDRNGGGTAKFHFTITGVDSKKQPLTIDRENMFYSNSDLLKNINGELHEAMTILMQNKFERVDVYSINVDAQISDQVQVAEIKSVRIANNKVKPGEKIALELKLLPYRGEEFVKKVYFTVPKDYHGDKLSLNVRGGSSVAWVMNLLRKQQEEGVPAQKKDTKRNLADFIKSVNEADKNNEIIVDIAAVGQANPEAVNQDAGLAGILQGSPFKQKYPCDFIVDGEVEVTLDIQK